MMTPEQSRAIRAELGLSQRRAAAEANVPRSYLNQFERGRWNPTDGFLAKLEEFYEQFGGVTVEEPTWESADPTAVVELPDPTFNSQCDAPASSTSLCTDEGDIDSQVDWEALGKTALIIGIVGGVLAATGNLPAAAVVFGRVASGLRPRSPLGF